jgi:pilus assembly protein CpaC
MFKRIPRGLSAPLLAISALLVTSIGISPAGAQQPAGKESIIRRIRSSRERLDLKVNQSRILTLGQKITQAQVNNPALLDLTALSPTEIQIAAKKAGVTQVNLWGADNQIYSIDVLIFGDAEELTVLLRREFPKASIHVIPVANGALISGYVDQPEHVSRILQIAEEFYPKVISNLTVGGVQQVLLHVRVMEVSRTKLRSLGFDWSKVTGQNVIVSGISGLLASVSPAAAPTAASSATFAFHVVDGTSAFFGVLEALRQDNLMKVLAEPTLVTVSGRPAFFNVGGEFPILVPQSLGTVSIEYKKYGTQVDFVPIVLGNGRIRLEVRPRVSEIDNTRSVDIQAVNVPGLRVREVDTGVELGAGQTLAIAGLVQNRVDSRRREVPWIGELPYLGAAFRRVEEENNEVELLILVTPELVDAMDPHEVPKCGPGMHTDSPNDWQLFLRGHIEVPRCCPGGSNGCKACAGGQPTRAEGQPLPGMILEPSEQAAPASQPKPVPTPATSARRRVWRTQTAKARPAYDRSRPTSRQDTPGVVQPAGIINTPLPGFIGPVGYDAAK